MKSEHRHELAENDLSKLIVRARNRIEPHTNKILIGILAVTVAAVGTIMIVKASSAARQAGFSELAACTNAEDYETVADKYPDSPAGIWARLRAAQEHLQQGVEFSISDRSASNDRLEESRNAFEIVLDNRNAPPEAREKALYGIAICLESLAGDDDGLDQAVQAYKTLITEFPETRYHKWAEERIKVLNSDEARDFYKWFHAQAPQPEERPLPFDTPDPFAGIELPSSDTSATGGDIPPPPPSAVPITPAPTPPETDGPALPDAPDETPADASDSDESTSPEPEDGNPGDSGDNDSEEAESNPEESDAPSNGE